MALKVFLTSPLVVFILFMGIGGAILYLGSLISVRGRHSDGKNAHYACGEDLATPDLDLKYHAFYRLALLFGICHITALVISTIPIGYTGKVFPLVYLVGALLSLAILWERKAN
jgi:NADH:ubiquinone oxidoreductase subunit 3 (subunit A)